MEILADYARSVAMELLVETNGTQHPTGLAGLRGARLAKAVETEEGRSWALGRIKAMTGGDRLTARLMRRDFFDFDPAFKLLAMGNHRPKLRRVDQAIRRRCRSPITVTITEPDRQFRDKLRGELPGILAWAIGDPRLAKQGLAPPPIVRDASMRYFEAEDAVARWLDDGPSGALEPGPRSASSRPLPERCQANEADAWTERALVDELEDRGFQYHRLNKARFDDLQ
jgi:putative DNA primase/helicase